MLITNVRYVKNFFVMLANLLSLLAISQTASATNKIDILVLYDNFTEERLNGTNGVETTVATWVDEVNDIFSDSDIDLEIRSATVEFYEDAGDADSRATLTDIRSSDTIAALRDQYAADFVIQLSPIDDYCGIAYVTVSPDWAFSVVDPRCSVTTFAHEIGHNMGLRHDFIEDPEGGVLYTYARGHGETENFRTIMAYYSSFQASRLHVFSNPRIDICKGSPCGVPAGQPEEADASLAVNNEAEDFVDHRHLQLSHGLTPMQDGCSWKTVYYRYGAVVKILTCDRDIAGKAPYVAAWLRRSYGCSVWALSKGDYKIIHDRSCYDFNVIRL